MENRTNLYKALAGFIQEVPVIHKDTKGYGYTYTNLTGILTVINPIMKKHGLGFTQLLEGTGLRTIIFHCESGESIESFSEIPQNVSLKGMNEFQVLGSANTYIRRYALSSALGLVTDKDIDACGIQNKKLDEKELGKIYAKINACENLETLTKYYKDNESDFSKNAEIMKVFILKKKEFSEKKQ